MQNPDIDDVWLAGYMDGEAYIGWDRTPRVLISSTHRSTLEHLKARYGGSICAKTGLTPNQRPAYAWQVTGENARNVLRRVLPFLREKSPQATLVLSVDTNPPGRPLSDAQRDLRAGVREKLLALRHAVS